MERENVRSSNLESIGYDYHNEIIELRFKNISAKKYKH